MTVVSGITQTFSNVTYFCLFVVCLHCLFGSTFCGSFVHPICPGHESAAVPLWPLQMHQRKMFPVSWKPGLDSLASLHLLAPVCIGVPELLDIRGLLGLDNVLPKVIGCGLCSWCLCMDSLVLLPVRIECLLDKLKQHKLLLVLGRPPSGECPCCASCHSWWGRLLFP